MNPVSKEPRTNIQTPIFFTGMVNPGVAAQETRTLK
jgi:hypothetical protein